MAEEEPKKSRAGLFGGIAGAAVSAFASLNYAARTAKNNIAAALGDKTSDIAQAFKDPTTIAADAKGAVSAVRDALADVDAKELIDNTVAAAKSKFSENTRTYSQSLADIATKGLGADELKTAKDAAANTFKAANKAIRSDKNYTIAGAISGKMNLLEKVNSLSNKQRAGAALIFAGGTIAVWLCAKRLFGHSKDTSHVENLETQRLSHAQGAGLSA